MQDHLIQMPGNTHIGFSKSKEIGSIIKEMQIKNLLIVVDKNIMKMGLIDHVFDSLKSQNISYTIFDDIENEPTVNEIDKAIKDLNINSKFDGVAGIGGGSTLDVAKLLAVSEQIEGSIKNYFNKEINKSGLPTIMLPTTAGTGSEATPNSIVKDEEEELKVGIVSPYLVPDTIILDPQLIISLPPKITAETGIDAFTHAIECFVCNKANDISDLFALDAIRLISNNLRQAVKNGKNKKARYNMLLGSYYGGIAITNSGTGGVHALAYPLGGEYGLSHGLSNSILLAEVMRYNSKSVPEKFLRVAQAMGISLIDKDERETVNKVVNEIEKLVRDVGINGNKVDISINQIDNLAKSAMNVQRLLKNNPRVIEYEDAKKIYKKVLF